MQIRLLISIFLTSLGSAAIAQNSGVYLYGGFMTGETYLTLPEGQRTAYVMGLMDGYFYAPALDAPSASVTWLHDCISGMTNTQVTAVVDQYVRSNPIDWQLPAHILAGNALRKACPNAPKDAEGRKEATRY